MSYWAEVRAAITGSVELLLGAPSAMAHFDVSVGGFWRSFSVIILLAPTLIVSRLVDVGLLNEMGLATEAHLDEAALARVLNHIASFVVFPLALLPLAGPLGMKRTYVPFVIARNWTTIVGTVPPFLAGVAYIVGLFGQEGLELANAAALGFNLFYAYRVARIAGGVPPSQAAGLVGFDFVLFLVCSLLIARIF